MDYSGYKAMVCIFLYGGNQSINMVIPSTTSKYNEYATSRGALAISQSSLLTLNGTASDGYAYGLHPQCSAMQTMFNGGDAAVICNVGTLVQPTTKSTYSTVKLPFQLFSHVDQQGQWMTSYAGSPSRVGWAGKLADFFTSDGHPSNVSYGIAAVSGEYWNVGNLTNTYVLGLSGSAAKMNSINSGYRSNTRKNALTALYSQAASDPSLMVNQLATVQTSAATKQVSSAAAFSAAGSFSTVSFDSSGLESQLYMVARLIKGRASMGDSRQMFFLQHNGYDTHNSELSTLNTLYGQLSTAIGKFNTAMTEIGMTQNVVAFLNSDFARSVSSNGDGTDHGWGGHSMAFGGPVVGGFYGTMPSLVLGGADDVDTTGRLIPTTSTDQYAATICRWFGMADADLNGIFPNLPNFSTRNLGFLG